MNFSMELPWRMFRLNFRAKDAIKELFPQGNIVATVQCFKKTPNATDLLETTIEVTSLNAVSL